MNAFVFILCVSDEIVEGVNAGREAALAMIAL
jgi:hypothetical protein